MQTTENISDLKTTQTANIFNIAFMQNVETQTFYFVFTKVWTVFVSLICIVISLLWSNKSNKETSSVNYKVALYIWIKSIKYM